LGIWPAHGGGKEPLVRCAVFNHINRGVGVLAALAVSLAAASAHACDTVETWDPGATDAESYLGVDGIDQRPADRAFYRDVVLGYGLLDRLSAFLGAGSEGNGALENDEAHLSLGVFGTPVHADHFNLDLLLTVGASGPGLSQLSVTPALEANLNLSPDMRSWGVYLRLGVPISGGIAASDGSAGDESGTQVSLAVNPGMYLTLGGRHQVLLEYHTTLHPRDAGALALGYNVKLNDWIELISEVSMGLPDQGSPSSFGCTFGFIATLPGKG
jgi:hypothetical protein